MAQNLFLWIGVYSVSEASQARIVREIFRFWGDEVRSCVFEIWATHKGVQRLYAQTAEHLGPDDALRLYRVCADCRKDSRRQGVAPPPTRQAAIIL